MLLQTVTAIVYDITVHSWAAASILVKYYLVAASAQLYLGEGLTVERFKSKLLRESRLVVPAIVFLGVGLYVVGLKPVPVVRLFSEVVVLVYLGVLFWEY